jgi:hypothetical protein
LIKEYRLEVAMEDLGGSGQVQLPRFAEAIVESDELAAEPIIAGRHQYGPALREPGERPIEFLLAGAVHEQGNRRRESESVPYWAVDAGQLIARQRELGPLD